MRFSPLWRILPLIIAQTTLTPALGAATSGTGYTVKSGDTFAKIARTKGIPLATLLKANRISSPDRISIGQRIIVPGTAKTAAKTPAKAEPKTVKTKTPAKTASKPTPAPEGPRIIRNSSTTVNIAPPATAGTYIIQSGDTLSRISSRTGLSAAKLMALNGLTEDSTLRIGQTLRTGSTAAPARKVPAIEQPATAYAAPAEYLDGPAPAPAARQETATISHRVKSGETFSSLTRRYGVTTAQLSAANRGVDSHRLRAGQTLLIPGQPARPQAKPLTVRADGRILADHGDPLDPGFAQNTNNIPIQERTRTGYQVESGDTLADIARRCHTTTDYLRGLNRMGPSEEVYPGRYLLVPFAPQNPAAPGTRRDDA
jgi:LysM repeat protein